MSYIIGHNGQAAVIDPRRDCQVYVDIARSHGARITHIFETHRNEDYVVGSLDLSRRTGAEIHHGKNLDFAYGKMEEYNQQGAPHMNLLPEPAPISAGQFERTMAEGMLCLDLRSPEAFAGAFIPGSLAIPLDIVPGFAGYFLPYDKTIGLVVDSESDVDTAVRYLIRLGFDNIGGYLAGGLHAWETSGKPYDRIAAVHVDELTQRVKEQADFTLLDVREKEELEQTGKFPGFLHIFLGELPGQISRVPRDKAVTTFCGSGKRAIIAASILKQHGFEWVEDNLGSMAACKAAGCPIEG
ncbi:MAG: hypothetical protein K9K64_06225 [Desulfohalobiaceae bacterium]|nr:hypothetical protein [Desulfohalobiaceae bacterium]